MQCQQHPYIKTTYKCQTCQKFYCAQCCKLHKIQNHETITLLQLANEIKIKIIEQINRMNFKIIDFSSLKDWENGQNIIIGCMEEILQFVRKLFGEVRLQYRKICDRCWSLENQDTIKQLQKSKNTLEQWHQNLEKNYEQVSHFDLQKILQLNKLDSDEQLIDSSQSYILSQSHNLPKISFNQIALRRVNQSLSKIIYVCGGNSNNGGGNSRSRSRNKFGNRNNFAGNMSHVRTNSNSKNRSKISRTGSNRSIDNMQYISLCKFIEGTNIMYQYIVQNPKNPQQCPTLTKTQFRQFICPLKSVSLTIGPCLYLIGGSNKQNKPRKQILFYQRSYNTMRIIGLMKQGRVGHAVCSVDDDIYIYGGKSLKSLQRFNTKQKISQIVLVTKYEVVGASMTCCGNRLYIFGGTDGVQCFKSILCYNPQNKQLTQLAVTNMSLFSMPICPILQPLNQHQILILGGYYNFAGQSYNNSYITALNTKLNYFQIFSKGELIYPIMANGQNSFLKMKQGKVICLADLKRLRHRHGPNLPVLFTYNIGDDTMQLDAIGI